MNDRENTEILIEECLPLKIKLSFGIIGASNWALSNMAFSPITFYYNIKLGLSANLIGLAWLCFAFWNAINDPIFGILQDKTRTKLGRRIPYIRFGAPLLGLLFILLWIVPIERSQLTLFFYFLCMLLLFDTVYSLIAIAHASLNPEIAFSCQERANLSVYANILTAIGTGTSFILPLILLTGDETTNINLWLYPSIILLAITCSALIFTSSFNIKEHKYLQYEEPLGLIDSIRECFKNKPWLIVTSGMFCYTITNTIMLTGIYYYVDYIVRLSGILVIIPLLLIYGMFILFIIFLTPLMKRFSAKKLYIFGFLITGISFIMVFFLGWNINTALIAFIPLGIGFGAISIFNGVISADTFDYDEILTGKRREATYGGIGAIIIKPSISIANWLFLFIISRFGFIDGAGASSQPESAFLGIMVGFTIVPALFVFLSALIIKQFPLDGPEWDKQKNELKEIHDKKEKEFFKNHK